MVITVLKQDGISTILSPTSYSAAGELKGESKDPYFKSLAQAIRYPACSSDQSTHCLFIQLYAVWISVTISVQKETLPELKQEQELCISATVTQAKWFTW